MAARIAQLPGTKLSSFFALPSLKANYHRKRNGPNRLILHWRIPSVKEGSLKIAA